MGGVSISKYQTHDVDIHMCNYIAIHICIHAPPEPHVRAFYTVNTNRNCHCWVII